MEQKYICEYAGECPEKEFCECAKEHVIGEKRACDIKPCDIYNDAVFCVPVELAKPQPKGEKVISVGVESYQVTDMLIYAPEGRTLAIVNKTDRGVTLFEFKTAVWDLPRLLKLWTAVCQWLGVNLESIIK